MEWRGVVAIGLLVGCGPVVPVASETSGGEEPATTDIVEPPPMTSTSTSGMPPSTTTIDDMTSATTDPSSGDASSSSTGSVFIRDPETDGCHSSCECSVWDQDCPRGEKCMPWANDEGSSWNAVRCSPVGPGAGDSGVPCTVEDSPVSGLDSCVEGSMCWDVDPDTLQGECLAFCGGSENSPTCDEPGTTCVIANEGTLILCLPTCDPLEPTCDEGEGCYLLVDNDTQWACLPVGAPVMVSDGLLPAFCEPGTTAVDPALHAFCDPESEVCCGQICDVTAPACARPLQCVAAMEGSNAGVCVE